MPTSSLVQLPDHDLSHIFTLAKWYQIENGQYELSERAPEAYSGVYITLFGEQLTTAKLQNFLAFLHDSKWPVSAICQYHPHPALPEAMVMFVKSQYILTVTEQLKAQLREAAHSLCLQTAVLLNPPTTTKRGLLVMDMDSTAIKIECIDEIARLANVYDEVAEVTAQAMAGQLEFSESLHQRVSKLEGVKLSLIQALKSDLPLMEGVQALCAHLKKHNWQLAIASGGFTWFAEALQAPLQLDAFYANELEIKDNSLTGKVLGDIVDAQKKADILNMLANELELPKAQTVAMGDGANDLLMMAQAGLGIAVHGKPKVVAQADAAICEGSLLQVLYLLSIPQ
ncbi:phosphoserine phosphatase SerB [Pseudoalteromonas sp. S16_S37]|uniref:phosphoserine phosphatase SerB n=1 Tax=Pseudoalteromonas sp. S16_S37 TaxID=2720228 RepID=UPI0016817BE4|nr:phosphoserine phosphatase SerB [Pseudoalteromonas sp. S16_S37]MBD1581813.1 phosphoserine phosphatase SerB [Pseudoalteromonas sp. S16_S37]